MKPTTVGMMETPVYGVAEAAQYLRVPQNTLAYWLKGGGTVPPLIKWPARNRLACRSATCWNATC